MSQKNLRFPVLMKDKFSPMVVLFLSEFSGVVVVPASFPSYYLGSVHHDFLSASNEKEWELSPPATLSNPILTN